MDHLRLRIASCALLGLLVQSAAAQGASSATSATSATSLVTAPEDYLGKQVGADHFLANYTQLRGYWKRLDTESDRMRVVNIGTTSYGQPMVMAIISAKENFAKLDVYRGIAKRLALAKGLTNSQARRLAEAGKSVVWIDAGMHATESVAAQNILELVYRMVGSQDAETREILENVILLVAPANPDGMEMVANAYMATGRVGGLPVLYQKYIGHDNNRDHYMITQPETEAITRILYREWYPQIVYNHHQSAPRGTIIFTPPFRDPFNYNMDPMVVRGISLVANHMNSRFSWEQKPGIISRSGASYSTWWNGGLRTTVYFHNMIGILTEVFGSPNPTPLTQTLRRRLPYSDYPDPVPSGMWHARQTVEYLQTANKAMLLLAARYRKEFLYNIYQMGRNSIRRGSSDHWTVTPKILAEAQKRAKAARESGNAREAESAGAKTFADARLRDARGYVMPVAQLDPTAVRRFVGVLIKGGLDVHRLTAHTVIAGRKYRKGAFVARADQAFRPHLRDMFEPQWHPDDVGNGGEPIRPYDSAGWTPALQMGVQFEKVLDGFDAPLELVTLDALDQPPAGEVSAGTIGYLLTTGDSSNFTCINRLVQLKEKVFCLQKETKVGRRAFPKGTFFIPNSGDTEKHVADLARDLGLDFVGVDRSPTGPALALGALRIGLFDVYGGNMPTGWAQWLLEQHEFSVQRVFGDRIHAGDLRGSFDVLVFNTGLPDPGGAGRTGRALRRGRPNRVTDADMEKLAKALPPFEDWSTMSSRRVRLTKAEAMPALQQFVKDGGVLVALGSQSVLAARLFELPVRDGVTVAEENGRQRLATSSEFFIPSSLIRTNPAKNSMITTGMPDMVAAMFRRSPVFRVKNDDSVKVLARYPETGDLLMSGWAIGQERLRGRAAAVEAEVGAGKVYLFGADVLYRGQPQATIKMFFNSIVLGAAPQVSELR